MFYDPLSALHVERSVRILNKQHRSDENNLIDIYIKWTDDNISSFDRTFNV